MEKYTNVPILKIEYGEKKPFVGTCSQMLPTFSYNCLPTSVLIFYQCCVLFPI